MAISDAQYRLIKALRRRGRLPERCALSELGEQNWYVDALTTRRYCSFHAAGARTEEVAEAWHTLRHQR